MTGAVAHFPVESAPDTWWHRSRTRRTGDATPLNPAEWQRIAHIVDGPIGFLTSTLDLYAGPISTGVEFVTERFVEGQWAQTSDRVVDMIMSWYAPPDGDPADTHAAVIRHGDSVGDMWLAHQRTGSGYTAEVFSIFNVERIADRGDVIGVKGSPSSQPGDQDYRLWDPRLLRRVYRQSPKWAEAATSQMEGAIPHVLSVIHLLLGLQNDSLARILQNDMVWFDAGTSKVDQAGKFREWAQDAVSTIGDLPTAIARLQGANGDMHPGEAAPYALQTAGGKPERLRMGRDPADIAATHERIDVEISMFCAAMNVLKPWVIGDFSESTFANADAAREEDKPRYLKPRCRFAAAAATHAHLRPILRRGGFGLNPDEWRIGFRLTDYDRAPDAAIEDVLQVALSDRYPPLDPAWLMGKLGCGDAEFAEPGSDAYSAWTRPGEPEQPAEPAEPAEPAAPAAPAPVIPGGLLAP